MRVKSLLPARSFIAVVLCAVILMLPRPQHLSGQSKEPALTDREQAIVKQIGGLRSLADDVRARTTKDLALQIRQLPVTPGKVSVALDLATLSTEGDFGRDTLQEVTTTLASALRERPVAASGGKRNEPAGPYIALAQLIRYEHMQASLNDPQLAAATALLVAADVSRQKVDFTLTDLNGKKWNLKSLRGKVVLVNFWATWCPPCRKEMPDLQALQNRFKDQGFVILAISDEKASVVKPYLAEHKITYPVMLDPGDKVNKLFQVVGIPKSFVYDRDGKLAAQSIDMRTQRQFLEMLAQAGLK
ncbi:MAG TPA: TlpA disulfide reductase family protein [Terriglobia bacterium]|nr:TlpA disulfide reductase family protein [Terriglobia bacterium]